MTATRTIVRAEERTQGHAERRTASGWPRGRSPRCGETALVRAVLLALALLPFVTRLRPGLFAQELTDRLEGRSASDVASSAFRPDLLVVDADDVWLLPAATAVAGRLAQAGDLPLLRVRSDRAEDLAAGLPARDPVWIRPRDLAPARGADRDAVGGVDATSACLRLAARHWPEGVEDVVLAPFDDPGALVRATLLAAHRGSPLVPRVPGFDAPRFSKACEEMGVRRVLHVAGQTRGGALGSAGPHPTGALPFDTLEARSLTEADVDELVVEALERRRVRNVILARVPTGFDDGVRWSSWLAPYLSLARRAPVVWCESARAEEVEEAFFEACARHTLRPDTVTIIGDTDAIGTRTIEIPCRPARVA